MKIFFQAMELVDPDPAEPPGQLRWPPADEERTPAQSPSQTIVLVNLEKWIIIRIQLEDAKFVLSRSQC